MPRKKIDDQSREVQHGGGAPVPTNSYPVESPPSPSGPKLDDQEEPRQVASPSAGNGSEAAARILGLDQDDLAPSVLNPDNAAWGTDGRRKRRDPEGGEPSYYDISLLKAPLWKWEIASYFYLGGLSAGAFVLARLGEILGGKKRKYRGLTRAGSFISAATALPCAPLLIHDLGDPARFHHMLRVFKPSSPMSLGSWTLTGYSAMTVLAALREFVKDREDKGGEGEVAESPEGKALDRTVMMATDAFGIPLALVLAGYTGVLLSTSANPLWRRNPWIGALFSASAMHTGSSSIRLALALSSGEETPAIKALEKIDTTANILEAGAMAAYLSHAGELAKPLTDGQHRRVHKAAIGLGIVAPAILDHLPVPKKAKRWTSILACLLGLIGGFALRWAFVHAGQESANDPDQARKSSRA